MLLRVEWDPVLLRSTIPDIYWVCSRCIPASKYIPCIYLVYIRYILAYTKYIPGIYFDVGIYLVYTRYIASIQNSIPDGWCCGGGQGPIPPVPPATTSPGLVMALIITPTALILCILALGRVGLQGVLGAENWKC